MSVSFDFEQLTERQRYKLIIGTIIPRPIALVTTVDDPAAVDALRGSAAIPAPPSATVSRC